MNKLPLSSLVTALVLASLLLSACAGSPSSGDTNPPPARHRGISGIAPAEAPHFPLRIDWCYHHGPAGACFPALLPNP